MKIESFVENLGAVFYTGVPDSQLKALCNYLLATYGSDSSHHVVAANEGNAVAIAAGYHLSTGRTPVVYLQNSGEGNVINPIASLLHEKVYAIPAIFVVGWRGEPGVHDEPQHVYQGEITLKLLEDMQIPFFVVGSDTTEEALKAAIDSFRDVLEAGKSVAFVIRKGALTDAPTVCCSNNYAINREEAIRHIVAASGEDPVVSTTGKISRELFEIREARGQDHKYDFLTVGSMGHSSSIALGIALQKPARRIWCIDGDGAALMHMGAMATIGAAKPGNLIHIVLNNSAHESVGGMPTVADQIELSSIAAACGYANIASVDSLEALNEQLDLARDRNELSFIEVKCALGSREDLGRPTVLAVENKKNFMRHIDLDRK